MAHIKPYSTNPVRFFSGTSGAGGPRVNWQIQVSLEKWSLNCGSSAFFSCCEVVLSEEVVMSEVVCGQTCSNCGNESHLNHD